MQSGYRLSGRIANNRVTLDKRIWEYTPGIPDKTGWMTSTSGNADGLTRTGDIFDSALKRSRRFSLAVPATEMNLTAYRISDYYDSFKILWYATGSADNDDWWKMIIFHHVTVSNIISLGFDSYYAAVGGSNNAAFSVVTMDLRADVEYIDKFGKHY